ncbi:hypothetical protein KJ848_02465 [Patescibacteria group bacterium]|nr:hypothetical protein [Patescibacteria group bacterium]MBU2159020.1 hypothetical protein [Patescibacteria group bacterium]
MSKVFFGLLVAALSGVIIYSLGAHYVGTQIMPGGGGPSLFAPTLQWLFVAVGAVAIYMGADGRASLVFAVLLLAVACALGVWLHVSWQSWLWAAAIAAVGATFGNLFVPIQRRIVSGH